MILELKVKNFRSYKDETTFTMIANSSEQKSNNIADISNDKQSFRVLKTSMIYGANASGKSNIIRALYEIIRLVIYRPKVDDKIKLYTPFEFDGDAINSPSEFEISFIGPNNIKFDYKIVVGEGIVLEEILSYYPNGKSKILFSRNPYVESERIQTGVLRENKKKINVFANQLILSKFGTDEPHEILTDIYLYFKSLQIINATNESHIEKIFRDVSIDLTENDDLRKRLSKLIKAADTKVNDITIHRIQDNLLDGLDSDSKKAVEKNPFFVFGYHDLFENDEVSGYKILPLEEESTGTQLLYSLGGKIMRAIQDGGVIIVDEFDTSLHPFITKMIVMIFQSKIINNRNAQLIFSTHDVSLLDRDLIRRDQVWITEKNEKGVSELFSLQDFDGLREDTPFEKWYLAGKFGGLPQIKSIESLFSIESSIDEQVS